MKNPKLPDFFARSAVCPGAGASRVLPRKLGAPGPSSAVAEGPGIAQTCAVLSLFPVPVPCLFQPPHKPTRKNLKDKARGEAALSAAPVGSAEVTPVWSPPRRTMGAEGPAFASPALNPPQKLGAPSIAFIMAKGGIPRSQVRPHLTHHKNWVPIHRLLSGDGWETTTPGPPTFNPPQKLGAPSFAFILAKGGRPRSQVRPHFTHHKNWVAHPSPSFWRWVGYHGPGSRSLVSGHGW